MTDVELLNKENKVFLWNLQVYDIYVNPLCF